MGKIWGAAAFAAAMIVLVRAATADAVNVGAVAEVRRTVYGVPPDGGQSVKRKGDAVVFQEALETLDRSGALIRFIDDSKLTLGEKTKVLIDAFVFDPENATGNALIDISIGTLRFVTGDMPKGGTVIKTPTATLVLRGTDVVVHVHPDGTTDATVNDGEVEGHNDVTDESANLLPGDSMTFGEDGTSDSENGGSPPGDVGDNDTSDPPEHRRSDPPRTDPPPSDPAPDPEPEPEPEDE